MARLTALLGGIGGIIISGRGILAKVDGWMKVEIDLGLSEGTSCSAQLPPSPCPYIIYYI